MATKVTVSVDSAARHEVNVQADSAISPTVLQPGQSVTVDVAVAVRVSEGQEVASLG